MSKLTRTVTVVAAAALALAGCADREAAESTSAAGTNTAYPLTIENCGQQVTVDAPPRRAVSLNQGSTEILLSLGLADRMVGTATWTDPIRANLAADNAKVPRLDDNKPSFETVLDVEPDFVSASFGGTLGPGGVAERSGFENLGVPTYLAPSDCVGKTSVNGDGARSTPLEIEAIFAEIRDLAQIFDVPQRGSDLIADLTERLAKASGGLNADDVTLAYWFADAKSPYMAGCCGSSGLITEALGAKNVFDDTTDEWPQVNWESVLDRDPDALVLGDLSRRRIEADALDSKIAFLESNPVTQRLTAVRNKRYIVVNGADMNPSIRTVDGIEKVAAGLRDLGLAK